MELEYKDIIEITTSSKIKPIGKGWCGDEKYYVETENNKKMMVCVSNIKNYDFIEKQYYTMKKLENAEVPIPKTIGFGKCNDNKNVYILTHWCNGENLSELLSSFPEQKQYEIGKKSGIILQKIHTVTVSEYIKDWAKEYIKGKVLAFTEIKRYNLKIDGIEAIISYFENSKHLINNNKICLNHGDFHSGNILFSEDEGLVIVDWDNYRYSDPYNDFMEIYNSEIVPYYLTGLVHGYFNGKPSEDFWAKLALYLSSAVLESVSWAAKNAPDYVEICIKNVKEALCAFNYMKNNIPKWYIKEITL